MMFLFLTHEIIVVTENYVGFCQDFVWEPTPYKTIGGENTHEELLNFLFCTKALFTENSFMWP